MNATSKQYHGKPCIHGHGTLRFKACRQCVECRRTGWKKQAHSQAERSARWRAANPGREHDRYRRWAEKNKEQKNRNCRLNYRLRASAEGVFTEADEQAMLAAQQGLCRFFNYCGNKLPTRYHRDHIVPIIKGGTHWPANRQLLCPTCNSRKGTKDQDVFLAEIGVDLSVCVGTTFECGAPSRT